MHVGVSLLLHGNGWYELLMVAVGLVLAFVVISITGQRNRAPEGGRGEATEEPEESRR